MGEKIHLTDTEAMAMAIEAARQGAGFVSPNPLVGCVILSSQGELLSKGYHAKVGEDHAEIAAIKALADPSQLQGATLFVTLEPCAHYGRTPPCAEALAQLPLERVVYGLIDPNPAVAGKGIAILKGAGKKVEACPQLRWPLEELVEIFLFNQNQKQAWTEVKVATTLDGQMSESSGQSQWITGEEARSHVAFLRGCHDAVAVGVQTFLNDNPKLNIRHANFKNKKNKVIILDPQGRGLKSLQTSELLKNHLIESIIWVCDEKLIPPQEWLNKGLNVWSIPSHNGLMDWVMVTKKAFQQGICSILVEGGAFLIGALMQSHGVQRWNQFIAPDLMGLQNAINVGRHWSSPSLNERQKLLRPSWQSFGRDLFLTGRLA